MRSLNFVHRWQLPLSVALFFFFVVLSCSSVSVTATYYNYHCASTLTLSSLTHSTPNATDVINITAASTCSSIRISNDDSPTSLFRAGQIRFSGDFSSTSSSATIEISGIECTSATASVCINFVGALRNLKSVKIQHVYWILDRPFSDKNLFSSSSSPPPPITRYVVQHEEKVENIQEIYSIDNVLLKYNVPSAADQVFISPSSSSSYAYSYRRQSIFTAEANFSKIARFSLTNSKVDVVDVNVSMADGNYGYHAMSARFLAPITDIGSEMIFKNISQIVHISLLGGYIRSKVVMFGAQASIRRVKQNIRVEGIVHISNLSASSSPLVATTKKCHTAHHDIEFDVPVVEDVQGSIVFANVRSRSWQSSGNSYVKFQPFMVLDTKFSSIGKIVVDGIDQSFHSFFSWQEWTMVRVANWFVLEHIGVLQVSNIQFNMTTAKTNENELVGKTRSGEEEHELRLDALLLLLLIRGYACTPTAQNLHFLGHFCSRGFCFCFFLKS